jgi:diguanylate cyclase (GGDEF)-like protein
MRIGSRLNVSFTILLLLLLAVAMVSLTRLSNLTTVTQSIVDVQAKRVDLAHQANQHAQSAATKLLELLQTSEREHRIPLYASMDAEIAAMDAAFANIGINAETARTTQMKALLLRINELRNTYDNMFRTTVETIELEGTVQARVYFENKTQGALDALLEATSALSAHEQQRMRDKLEQLKLAESDARTLLITIALITLVLGKVLAWFITRSIVVPVSEAVDIAEAIAQGDLGKLVPAGRPDEMGKLLQSLGVMRDSITSREDKILKLAYEDTLTGLPNRTRFMERFAALPDNVTGAVVMLDIDRFALINSALGHPTGDLLLREIALRLRGLEPAPNLIVRLWADKFAFLLEGADKHTATAFAEAVIVLLQQPITLDGQRMDVNGTLGLALYPQDGNESATLLRRAENAIHFAKRRHIDFAFVTDVGNEPAHENLSLIGEMREAMERHEFLIYYQPKMRFADHKVSGTEALIRWKHPVRGLVPPMSFIPFAEQTGFIRYITPWLIEEVIGHAADWRSKGYDIIPSVNLSTLDLLDPWLIEHIDGLLKKHGLAPQHLCLEITESALMDQPELALKHLNELSALGLKLSIDDYGSGQASLSYLKKLPVNELKIDREFITAVSSMRKNSAIVRSTILLCHELGLTVVAEGAETPEELAWLQESGCDVVQGYGIAKPMPLADFLPWVSAFDWAKR